MTESLATLASPATARTCGVIVTAPVAEEDMAAVDETADSADEEE